MRPWLSTETTGWVGASSAHPTRCRGSRSRGVRQGSDDLARLADCVWLCRKGAPASGRGRRRARRCARPHRRPGWGHRGGVPGGCRFGARRLSYNGALSTYQRLGFVRGRKIGKHRWAVTRPSSRPRSSARSGCGSE